MYGFCLNSNVSYAVTLYVYAKGKRLRSKRNCFRICAADFFSVD